MGKYWKIMVNGNDILVVNSSKKQKKNLQITDY